MSPKLFYFDFSLILIFIFKDAIMSEQTKRYYWLKLQDNFFERDEIKIIEAMPNGKDYILFYLKIMLKSINENGRLIFKRTLPYSNEMLSTITGTNIDVVRVNQRVKMTHGQRAILTHL